MRWHIGDLELAAGDSSLVSFSHQDLVAAHSKGRTAFALHELSGVSSGVAVRRGDRIDVVVPTYRPRKFLDVLCWLTSVVGEPGVEVTWLVESSKGPKTVRKALEQVGWKLDLKRDGRTTRLTGRSDRTYEPPAPLSFTAELGAKPAELFADYGVFSPGRVDDGTTLLLDVALAEQPVRAVADIGVGYGPLGLGLALNGIADRVSATDVDSVALWIAAMNAERLAVPTDLTLTDDPGGIEPTELTVCNIPTHISSAGTRLLTGALGERARHGRVLTVVHSSLTQRYTRYFTDLGRTVTAHEGPQHTVLTITR
ncbi:MAG TPA: methyltransferase [Mycobacteriales bacterium]|nr:methyltransferase [Mycobacteriales bacterium]